MVYRPASKRSGSTPSGTESVHAFNVLSRSSQPSKTAMRLTFAAATFRPTRLHTHRTAGRDLDHRPVGWHPAAGAGAARKSAQNVKCASNMRQLGIGFMGYATDNGGKFPLNLPNPRYDTWWYQHDVIGAYIPGEKIDNANSIGGLSMACPSDVDSAARSYTMNYWASSDPNPPAWLSPPSRGEMWDAGAPNASRLILAVESLELVQDGRAAVLPGVDGWRRQDTVPVLRGLS